MFPQSDFQNNLARDIFGISFEDAISQKICIKCKVDIFENPLKAIELDEWLATALCPLCSDEYQNPVEVKLKSLNQPKLHIER